MKKSRTLCIAAAASVTALNIVLVSMSFVFPLFFPLLLAEVLLYLLFSLCGVYYGIAALVLSCGASAFMLPAGMMYLLFFAPHAFLCYLLANVKIKTWLKYILRYIVLLVFCNASLFVLYKAAMLVMFDMERIIDTLGGYAILAVVFSAVFIVYDLLFQNIRRTVFAMPFIKKYFYKDKHSKANNPQASSSKPDSEDIFKN